MKEVLVTGGNGFLGAEVVRQLHAARVPTRVLDRHGTGRFAGDLRDAALLREALRGCGTVLHLAWSGVPAQEARSPNLEDGRALLAACRAEGVRRVVFASSGGTVYGRWPAAPVGEDARTEPVSAYGAAKLAFERMLLESGLPFRIARIGNAYGPRPRLDKPQGAIEWFLRQVREEGRVHVWGDGRQVRDFVHVSDVARALLLLAADEGPFRVYNVGSGRGRSILEVLGELEAVLGRPIPRVHDPAHANDVPYSVLDCSRAHGALGWRPQVDFREGLRATAKAMGVALPAEA